MQSLNFGIDFRGGTSIRTESSVSIDIAAYRNALSSLDLGDITISEVLAVILSRPINFALNELVFGKIFFFYLLFF